jgi:hypothetical protein
MRSANSILFPSGMRFEIVFHYKILARIARQAFNKGNKMGLEDFMGVLVGIHAELVLGIRSLFGRSFANRNE